MAKKQSNTSENSAASQGAKPGMFIPIPTAEITNAAETARIRAEKEAEEARIRAEKEAEAARKKAEKEAKKKADKEAADAVVALIRAIGVVEYTDACLEKINAANQAYAKLTADQKKLVENADVITTSEKEYDKLKKAAEEARKKAEKEAKEKADKKAADVVIALIRAIGVVEYTDACHKKIEAAKQAYNQLTQEQMSLVENGVVFIASVIKYKELEVAAAKAEEARKKAEKEAKEKADKEAADAVVALIRAIGVVEYTDACLEKINAANQAYAKLTADQKKLVENADVITTSEKEYAKLKNAAEKAAEVARKKAEREAKEVRKKAEYDAKKAKHEEISVKLKEYCLENDRSISTTWGTFRISNIKPADLWEFLQSKKDGQFKILTKEIEYKVKANASDLVDIKKHHFNISSKETKSASSTETLPQKVKRADYDTYRALLNDGKQPKTGIIGRIDKIFRIGFVVLWAFFLIVNAIYTWAANSWFSCIIWVIITIAVFFGIMSLMQKIDEGHSVDTKSPDAGSFAHLAWRICWVLGLSIICEIIMMVIFVF